MKRDSMKQAIVVRSDLDMGEGKKCTQVAHASISAFRKASTEKRNLWLKEGQRKIVLKVESKEKLLELKDEAKEKGVPYNVVKDAGRTELRKGTLTTLGLGPDRESNLDKVIGSLPLL